jgi:hypothetical protein
MAWNDWYNDALESIEDLVPESDQKLNSEIIEAQLQLESFTNSLIHDLEK